MAESMIEQSWNQPRGETRTHWGRITDEDGQRAEAEREELLSALQKRYGCSRSEAEGELQKSVSTRTPLIDVEALRDEAALGKRQCYPRRSLATCSVWARKARPREATSRR